MRFPPQRTLKDVASVCSKAQPRSAKPPRRGPRILASAVSAALSILVLCSCAEPEPIPRADPGLRLPTIEVGLPGGALVTAELAMTPEQQARGLMFRSYVPPDRGMLFVGDRASRRSFWMYQCLVPLDMVWLDGAHRIVEIVREAPPCREADPQRCPSYGGTVNSVYVLELAAGQAEAHGLRLGDRLDF